MEEEVFSHLPRQELETYRRRLLVESTALLMSLDWI
jgi:hypothetical protein